MPEHTLRGLRLLADERAIMAALDSYTRVTRPNLDDADSLSRGQMDRIHSRRRRWYLMTEFSPAWVGTSGAQPDGAIRSPWAGNR